VITTSLNLQVSRVERSRDHLSAKWGKLCPADSLLLLGGHPILML
jgi:hypothetical protein